MGFWLFSAVALQVACAFCAAGLGRPAPWLQIILIVPVVGSLVYCAFEFRRWHARVAEGRKSLPGGPTVPLAAGPLGELGYRAARARTVESRRALAQECMRLGRHADARLLFRSCFAGGKSDDPALIECLEQAGSFTPSAVPPVETAE